MRNLAWRLPTCSESGASNGMNCASDADIALACLWPGTPGDFNTNYAPPPGGIGSWVPVRGSDAIDTELQRMNAQIADLVDHGGEDGRSIYITLEGAGGAQAGSRGATLNEALKVALIGLKGELAGTEYEGGGDERQAVKEAAKTL